MDKLSPDQAQALWSSGGFIVLSDLPEGSEIGIDGTFHVIRKFSGIKFVPPGLHLLTWCPSSSPASGGAGVGVAGPSTIPLRSAILRWFEPRERLVLRYDPKTEGVEPVIDSIITDDSLRGLDKELAPYPFDNLPSWKSLYTHVTPDIVKGLTEDGSGEMDGMTGIRGVDEEDERLAVRGEGDGHGRLRFPWVESRRSWREGAVGEEVTKYSKDKSWQFGHIVASPEVGGDPAILLGYLQLAFILLLHLSSYAGLQMYRRLLTLVCRSHLLLAQPEDYIPGTDSKRVRRTYVALVQTLAAQLGALPDHAFDAELPEMDLFYLDEIEHLRQGLSAGSRVDQTEVSAWEGLRKSARRWGWDLDPLSSTTTRTGAGEEEEVESEEEGEYAPQIVET